RRTIRTERAARAALHVVSLLGGFMLGPVRGTSAPPHGVRLLMLLVSWISIAGGLLAAPAASAATSEWGAAHTLQAGTDSVATPDLRRPGPATPATTTPPTSA